MYKRVNDVLTTVAVLVMLVVAVNQCHAQYAYFDSNIDTISLRGDSVAGHSYTYETRVYLTSASPGGGFVYQEYWDAAEDRHFSVGTQLISVGTAPLYLQHGSQALTAHVSVQTYMWHHVAYVYDGAQERIYLDGQLKASWATTGDAWSVASDYSAIGASEWRNDLSFIGYMDTFRLSTTARYFGNSFVPPTGDLTSDASTNLLLNFNEPVGSTTVTDLSGHGRNGTFGVGFVGATSPTIVSSVPEPSSLLVLLCGVSGLGLMRRRGKIKTRQDVLAG